MKLSIRNLMIAVAVSTSCIAGMLFATPVVIQRVIPNKILYRTGEDATARVWLQNTSATSQEGELRMVLEWDVDNERPLEAHRLTLAAGETRVIETAWNTGEERYGYALRATWFHDGRSLQQRAEFFNVIDSWWRVALNAHGGGATDSKMHARLLDYYHLPAKKIEHSWYASEYWYNEVGPFLSYKNMAHRYAQLPSFFGDLTPDIDEDTTWFSGRGWYPVVTRKLKEDVEHCREWGVKNSAYTQSSITGPAGFELARKHPEFVERTHTGAFKDGGYAPPDPMGLARGMTHRLPEWMGLMPNLYSEDAIRYQAGEMADSIEMFGWDAFFFDGCGYAVRPGYAPGGQAMPNGMDQEQISVRNTRLMQDIVRDRFPDVFLWYNGANPSRAGGTFHPRGNGGGLPARLAMMGEEASGTLKEHMVDWIADPRHVSHTWRSNYEYLMGERDGLRKQRWSDDVSDVIFYGYYHPIIFRNRKMVTEEEYVRTRDQWAFSSHLASIIAALQGHVCGGGSGFRPILQLMTRYSKFFWHEDWRIVDQTYREYAVDSLREIWWEEVVYRRETENGQETVINLINSPDTEYGHGRIYDDPEMADDVELACLKPNPERRIRAWAVRPYSYDSDVFEPVQEELTGEMFDGELVFRIPPFQYFTLVILREYKEMP